MRKKFLIFSLCAIGAATLALTGCGSCGKGNINKFSKKMIASADSAVVVDAQVTLEDEGVTVYTFKRHIEVDLETRTASVADTKITLSDNFEEATSSTTVPAENVTGETLIGLNLKKKLMSDYAIVDGDLTATIAADKISEVLSREVSATSDMTLKIDFEDGNLVYAEYSYVNSSSRTVNVTVTYGY